MTAWIRQRRPSDRSWRRLLWHRPPIPVLLAEAERLVGDRRWRAATRVLTVAADTTEGEARRPILERLAVTAADGGRHGLSREAVYELSRLGPHPAATWVAFANVALARGNHLHADRAARAALVGAPADHGAWASMTAGYAGLGWFDEAASCLDRLDRDALTPLDRWRIGRATNRWALAGAGWFVLTLAATPIVGVLALGLAGVGPLALRRWRIGRLSAAPLGTELAAMAEEAWRSTVGLRSLCGFVVAGSLLTTALAVLPG
jgi:hypothetical protein